MKRSYSLEEKLCAIGFVFQGESARSVSRRFHLGHHILYEWLESYKLYGVDGLKSHGHKKKRLSYEEKGAKRDGSFVITKEPSLFYISKPDTKKRKPLTDFRFSILIFGEQINDLSP